MIAVIAAFHSKITLHSSWYSMTRIYRASRREGFRPDTSGGGAVNRIVKCINLHINPVFGGRGNVPVNRGTRYRYRGFTVPTDATGSRVTDDGF